MSRNAKSPLALLIPLLLLAPAASSAQPQPEQDAVIRQTANPTEGAVIGERIALSVDVLFPGTMPRPPRVYVPDAPGFQTFRFESQGTTMRERIDGRDYVGQRFEFAVYPRRGGVFTLPPARVTFLDPRGAPVGTAEGTPTPVSVRVPQGVDPSTPVIASTSVSLSETWSGPDGTALKAGDAMTRIIRREAADVPALAMQAVPLSAPDGVRVYAEPPLSEDRIARGNLTGRRADTLTYVFERPGSYALPAVTQPWWDLRNSVPREESAAGRAVTVSAVPTPASPARPFGPWRFTWRDLGEALAVLVPACLLGWLAWRLGPGALSRWRAERDCASRSEGAAFRALLKAARSGEADRTYQAYLTWRSRLPAMEWTDTKTAVENLEAFLFRRRPPAAHWSKIEGRALAADFKRLRADLRRRTPAPRKPSALPPLNPISIP
ncbi:BatD family protein [Microvirga sp. TS319]|uniref:BatD family protein n=1 Tax=Microvirga sp. TS319 TaxID=3241165 RepID=UPI00351A2557